MTQITNDHVEWAVVSRLRRMLEEPPHQKFNVTQAYALFTTILCWVLQHTRIPSHEIKSDNDKIAHRLWENFSDRAIADDPWCVYVKPIERIELVGNKSIRVPPPRNFEEHTVDRFLINLRDATAHGDARKVQPFNFPISSEQLLVGFHFACAEYKIPSIEAEKLGKERSPSSKAIFGGLAFNWRRYTATLSGTMSVIAVMAILAPMRLQ